MTESVVLVMDVPFALQADFFCVSITPTGRFRMLSLLVHHKKSSVSSILGNVVCFVFQEVEKHMALTRDALEFQMLNRI